MSWCSRCEQPLGRTRLVIGGRPTCPDCAYELEYGPAERVQQLLNVNNRLQTERLFPVESYERKGPAPAA